MFVLGKHSFNIDVNKGFQMIGNTERILVQGDRSFKTYKNLISYILNMTYVFDVETRQKQNVGWAKL